MHAHFAPPLVGGEVAPLACLLDEAATLGDLITQRGRDRLRPRERVEPGESARRRRSEFSEPALESS